MHTDLEQSLEGLAIEAAELERLERRGISRAELVRQVELLRSPPPALCLDRAARLGDGIVRLDPAQEERRVAAFRQAVRDRRLLRFVPASGAASRMFADLVSLAAKPRPAELERLRAALPRLPFTFDPGRIDLAGGNQGATTTDFGEVASLLASLPKALVPFHRDGARTRTAAEEHLFEAAQLVGSGETARVHFTVAHGTRERFERFMEVAAAQVASLTGVRVLFELSEQEAATDTLALDGDQPARERDGLVLRPGGHGALLGNLERAGGDLVLIKNVDNILPRDRQQECVLVSRQLLGLLAQVRQELDGLVLALAEGPAGRELENRLAALRALGLEPPTLRAQLESWVDRPCRVCGVVENRGEPGGGPFWVRGDHRAAPSLQIVETSQIDLADPSQAKIVASATHFNPVLLGCAMRDARGRPFDLARFVDPRASLVASKPWADRELRVLERPGLWNGAMAGWITLFVEVPATVFAPVKTLWDLLRPEHQPSPQP